MIDWNQVAAITTAIATLALAIFAGLTLKGLKDQIDTMKNQTNLIL